MAWWSSNGQSQQQTAGTLNLGLPNGQQQVASQGYGGAVAWGAQPQMQQQQFAPPSEMDIMAAMISTNPLLERWMSANSGQNLQSLITLISSIVTVSVHQMLSQVVLKEGDDGYRFDFSAISGLPTPDSVGMTQSQMFNAASNAVQQQSMQVQQMVAMANQGMMQGMLNDALADPGMLQAAGQGAGSFVRSVLTGR